MSLKALLTIATLVAAPAAANAAAVGAIGTNGSLPILTLTMDGLAGVADLNGGSVYNASVEGVAAQPVGTVGLFLGAGPAASSPATFVFAQSAANYVSFLYGSPDLYNTLTVTTNVGPATVFSGATLVALAGGGTPGDQGTSQYLQFSTTFDGEFITSVSFGSTENAFEAANFRAAVVAVPGPVAGAGLFPILGLAGLFLARRRASSRA